MRNQRTVQRIVLSADRKQSPADVINIVIQRLHEILRHRFGSQVGVGKVHKKNLFVSRQLPHVSGDQVRIGVNVEHLHRMRFTENRLQRVRFAAPAFQNQNVFQQRNIQIRMVDVILLHRIGGIQSDQLKLQVVHTG
ncbi:unknown [Clostridium sp. CAG:448]|nr:unknown [Clostridium sp. CAG:448]